MKNIHLSATLALALLGAGCATPIPPGPAAGSPADASAGAPTSPIRTLQGAADQAPGQVIVKTAGPTLPPQALEALQARVLDRIPDLDLWLLRVPTNDVPGAARRLQASAGVLYAGPNRRLFLQGSPNDPKFTSQWAYGTTKLDAVKAWDAYEVAYGAATPGAIVAVVDCGIDQNHEDIDPTNSAAAPMVGKILIDKNFSSSTTVDDKISHGTHVAGIVGAVTNNAKGVAGTHRHARLYNLKIFNDSGTTEEWRTAQAIDYATTGETRADGVVVPPANVISMSFGMYAHSVPIFDALTRAQAAGLLLVAAAGNDNKQDKFFPAAYDGEAEWGGLDVIAVGATTKADAKASFSNFGTWVDVGAPGESIMSTLPNHFNSGLFKNYGNKSGTSMATPFVAGLAALLWPRYGNAEAVKARIQGKVDPVGTSYWQYGRIDMGRAFTEP